MPDFKLLAANHTGFTVTDLDRSLAFFTQALGFRATEERPHAPWPKPSLLTRAPLTIGGRLLP